MKKIKSLTFITLLSSLLLSANWMTMSGKILVKANGEFVRVYPDTNKSSLLITGDAKTEKIDEGIIKYSSKSGRLIIPLEKDEAIYGLTERLVSDVVRSEWLLQRVGSLDRRGEKVYMWIAPTYSLYAPFYISSRGYGMLVDGTFPGVYDIGKTKKDELKIQWETDPEDGFCCYFIFGNSYDQILDRYTKLIGRPILPPKWVFLPWRWRDEHKIGEPAMLDGVELNAELVEDITMYEKLGIPAGVYMIDRPWAQGLMGFGNLTFDETRFPNPEKMIEILHNKGYRVVVWGAPWAQGDSPFEFGPEAKKLGYIAKGGYRYIDYTNPDAVKWHKEKIKECLERYKIDGWKLDRGEEDVPSRKKDIYFDGRTGREVHNDYPRIYIKTYYEATKEIRGDDFVLMPRAGYTGTQKYGIVWGGDIPGTEKGLRAAIIASQRASFMGYPVWGSDTGGYAEFKDREVFARWLEFSSLCPLMEVGGIGNHAPWNMPKEPAYDEELIKIYRKYHKLHYLLSDYIYELAKQAHESGKMIIRPLVFDYPDDPKVKNMWDEYKLGPDLLVAPLWESRKREREVYLPSGKWRDFWQRSKTYKGPITIKYSAPLDVIPLFIKEGEETKFPSPEMLD